jgi:hypothetical protein
MMAILAGMISILLVYRLGLEIFKSRQIGLISSVLLTVSPAHVWLSSTPLTESFYTTVILACMLSYILYLRTQRYFLVILSALSLFIANGIRFEAWMVSIVFSSLLAGGALLQFRQGKIDVKQLLLALLPAAIPWLFPLAWLIGNSVYKDDPLYFLHSITSYKLLWYGSGRSYRNYLNILLGMDPFSTALLLPGILSLIWKSRGRAAQRWYGLMTVLPFLIFASVHGGQSEPRGNIIRYLAPFLFVSYPTVAYLIGSTVALLHKSRMAQRTLLIAVILSVSLVQILAVFRYTNDLSVNAFAVGERIRSLREMEAALRNRPVLIELSYWDYLAIHVGANDLSLIVYDRLLDFENRRSISLLSTDLEAFRSCLRHYQFSFVIVKSPDLKEILEQSLQFTPGEQVNQYTFYRVPLGKIVDGEEPGVCPLSAGTGY